MKLIADWRQVLLRAWSIRLILLTALLSGLEVAVSLLDADVLGMQPGTFALLAGIVSLAATVARLVNQASLSGFLSDEDGAVRLPKSRAGRAAGLVAVPAAVLAIGLPFTQAWEGTKLIPYPDIVGRWTVCTGETNVPMREYTAAECSKIFSESWALYYVALVQCFPVLASAPASVQAMVTDLGYNNGTPAVCASKVTGGAIKARRWADVCESLKAWVNAGGKKSKGLMNRRYVAPYNSYDVCMSGLKA